MSNSYRIRTNLGVDKHIKVQLDQNFEFLEILSLKILPSQVYTRPCSDYGVVIGRVSVNDGYGIPNCKVSVFIPLSDVDSLNPIISDLYPYRTVSDLNEDGYRYNLLPYTKTYSNHSPTGTFFTRNDVLTNPTLFEVYEKYYKYTSVTNESGDFMIFGVPTGTQTLVLDVDLSDIGEFSLSPQDLVRMGVATENQVGGTKFKTSTNLNSLPQIISITKTITVEPFWGQEEVCNIGITRTDFDLTRESNIVIEPTSIFMGSIISDEDSQFIKRNCKPKLNQGNLCGLVTGPGEIIAIRQTIFQDENGRPILETVNLNQGGRVIDENGSWVLDLPMNLDYVTTNEFGEKVLSDDPKKGIPTKAKYRFKVKWNQSPSLSQTIRRGNFLIPNIKEHGWDSTGSSVDTQKQKSSYSFSLDWKDYGNTGTTEGLQMIQDAIDCKDTFYPMYYNKVYTVSQFIDRFRKGVIPRRMTGIKHILDTECQSENNKFPTNDAFYRSDILFLLFILISFIFRPVLYSLVVVVHVLTFLLKYILGPILAFVGGALITIIYLLCQAIRALTFGKKPKGGCSNLRESFKYVKEIFNMWTLFSYIPLPNLQYPNCEMCNCKEDQIDWSLSENDEQEEFYNNSNSISNINSILTPYYYEFNYILPENSTIEPISTNLSGYISDGTSRGMSPQMEQYTTEGGNERKIFSTSLTIQERLNLFNVKAKYFDETTDNSGGGVNRIKVRFGSDNNPSTTYHYDNMVVLSVEPTQLSEFTPGKLVSFQDFNLSKDINLTGVTSLNQFNTTSITGTPVYTGVSSITVSYANPSSPNDPPISVTYNGISGETTPEMYHKYPMDVEYFQVITAMTYNTFSGQCISNSKSLNDRFLYNDMKFYNIRLDSVWIDDFTYNPLEITEDGKDQLIVFLVRGVDPNSVRNKCEYDLSILFGHNSTNGSVVVSGDYKLNHPIKPGLKNIGHEISGFQYDIPTYPIGGTNPLYYDSFHFQPTLSGFGSFSGFSSDLPKYYSKLDGTQTSFRPQVISECPTIGTFCNVIGNNGVRLNQVPNTGTNNPISFTNGFQYEWTRRTTNPCYTSNSFDYSPPRSISSLGPSFGYKGYLNGEQVEGGSVMFYYYDNLASVGCGSNAQSKGIGSYYAPSYYTNPSYFMNYQLISGVNSRKIVMRSDRLPTSTSVSQNSTNVFPLHTNVNFSIFTIDDEGVFTSIVPDYPGENVSYIDELTGDTPNYTSKVLDTFECNQMVPLSCYYVDDLGNIKVHPITENNECSNNKKGKKYMENGCYVLITTPLGSIVKDVEFLTEWINRITINFAACRNVWSHMFSNNWINGTLYMIPFKQDTLFTGPTDNPPNSPFSLYCTGVTFFNNDSNNFYYRSTPYNDTQGLFVGNDSDFNIIKNGNQKNIFFPTTIMDLGPRSEFLNELVVSDDYDGYVVNKIRQTSYNDVEEILNLFIVSRLVNTSFLRLLFSPGLVSVLNYFGRDGNINMVDGDYAQMISISSELGVEPFESENYPDKPIGQQSPVYNNGGNSKDGVFGIFFSSDTQVRDFISPKRTIINPNVPYTNNCSFSNINVFSQVVPFYQWEIKQNGDKDSIFGSQKNNWNTNHISGNTFFSKEYQSLDRNDINSRYFRPTNIDKSSFSKGYIYSVTSNATSDDELSADISTWNTNIGSFPRSVTVGSPYHFYFGLKRGKTALDIFGKKWINFENITVN